MAPRQNDPGVVSYICSCACDKVSGGKKKKEASNILHDSIIGFSRHAKRSLSERERERGIRLRGTHPKRSLVSPFVITPPATVERILYTELDWVLVVTLHIFH